MAVRYTPVKIAEDRMLRLLVYSLPEAVFAKDTAGQFIFANLKAATLLGVDTPEALIGNTDLDFYPQHQAAKLLAEEQTIVQTGQAVRGEEEQVTDPRSGQMR